MMQDKLYYGTAFYPELWPWETVLEDIRIMKDAGINVVRIGEFAWSSIEPEENEFDLSVFKESIDILYQNGIDTVLCTPTATPPVWLSHGHPERMHVDQDGNRMSHGARQHACTNHPYMRSRSRIIVERMARELGRLPGVIAWQTDNEFKCHVAECFCPTCTDLWHKWLEARYEKISRLNEAWGTGVWSQSYLSFDQVPAPVKAPFYHNASLSSMYRLFEREQIVEFQQEQLDIIRKYSDAPVTHNTSIWFRLHQEKLFENLDFFAFDRYELPSQYSWAIMLYDLGRNVKKGKKFWVMETSPSHAGGINSTVKAHPDGYLSALSAAAYSLGGSGFSYWLWRQQRSGCEMPHGSIISAWGKPAAGYKNVRDAAKVKDILEPILRSTEMVDPVVSLTYSDMANIFFTTESFQNLSYAKLFHDFYTSILYTGIPRNVIFENAQISENTKILMSPYMPCITHEYLHKARMFAENGGTWIVGPMSGGRTAEHTVHTTSALADLERTAGVEVVLSMPLNGSGSKGKAFGVTSELGHWGHLFRCTEAVSVGEIISGPGEKLSFISERKIGKGRVILIGAVPVGEEISEMTAEMIRHYAGINGYKEDIQASFGTLVINRKGSVSDYLVLINVDGNGGTFTLPEKAWDEINSVTISEGKHKIKPYDICLLKMKG
ncbi:beta-galactosidase [Candidatus Nomurabacteria bacterium]|nr:beta-galactosidase [Candidatus Nomurabacteria bacterium]